MKTLFELLCNLSSEQVMRIWRDDTITNVANLGDTWYRFHTHVMSHGEMITSEVELQVDIDAKGAFLSTIHNVRELKRVDCSIN